MATLKGRKLPPVNLAGAIAIGAGLGAAVGALAGGIAVAASFLGLRELARWYRRLRGGQEDSR